VHPAAAGIKPGSDGSVRIRSVAAAVTRVQEKYKRLARGRNVVDELLVEVAQPSLVAISSASTPSKTSIPGVVRAAAMTARITAAPVASSAAWRIRRRGGSIAFSGWLD
jgi:hypothetical protein